VRKTDSRLKIVIASGGTGGHLLTAQSVGLDLMRAKPKAHVVFLSPGLSTNPYFRRDLFTYREVDSGTPYQKSPLSILTSCCRLIRGTLQSLYYLKKINPKIIIGFGSFHSFPPLLAARIMRIPIILFDPNIFPGKVNRLCSKWAMLTAVYFRKADRYLFSPTVCVHMPSLNKGQNVCPKRARAHFGLNVDTLTFLIFGGSQGSRVINDLFCLSLQQLLSKGLKFQVIHLVGWSEHIDRVREIYASYQVPAVVKSFEKEMHLVWSAADLSISRSGASTLSEQIKFNVPGILIPYPYATEDHQAKNASFVEEEIRGGIKLFEKDLTPQRLVLVIESLLDQKQRRLKWMRQSLAQFKKSQENRDFCKAILDVLHTQGEPAVK